MNTWSCRATLAPLALTLLAACEPGQGELFPGLGGTSAPVTQAAMAGGAITVKAPAGYCLDPRSISQRFALMARCDVLSAGSGGGGVPLSLITVSISPAGEATAPPSAEKTATALKLTNLSNIVRTGQSVLFQAEGAPPTPGMSARHWRGTGRVADQIVGFAFYIPKDTRISANRARAIMTALLDGVEEMS